MLKNIKRHTLQLVKIIYFVFAFLVTVMIVFKSLDYINPNFSKGFLYSKKEIFHAWYKYFLFTHIFTAPISVFSGLLQFSLKRKTKLHRLSGYIYILSVFLASTSGFFMSFKSIGGIVSGISFVTLSVLWVLFTQKAFVYIKEGKLLEHKKYMTRSFILANSAILLRLFSFVSNTYLNFDPTTSYILISWLSWLPWLLVYEFITHSRQKKSILI